MSLVTGLFFLVLLLNQRWSPPLRLQASHCRTFCIMCDVPSIAVFCSESIEFFPCFSKFFLKLLVTILVAPIITGIIVHFKFHIHCISIHKLLYFDFFSATLLLLLLLLLSSSSSSSSPLCRVFILIFLRQTMSLGNTVLNLLYFYISTFPSKCAVPNMALLLLLYYIILQLKTWNLRTRGTEESVFPPTSIKCYEL